MRALIRSLVFAAATLVASAGFAQDTKPELDVNALMAPSPLGDKVLGDPAAPVTMIEYASLTCPHCAAFNNEVFKAVKAKYIDTGKIRYILREFPLDQLALAAVMGARCAPAEEFFPIIDTLFREQKDWAFIDNPGPALVERLKRHGLDEDAFMTCLGNKDLQEKIIGIEEQASEKFGVDGTPAFFFNGQPHGGEMTLEQVDAMVTPMLTKQ
jgi:protein-disulfide isomerase